jgi:hypothetical protein
MPTDLPAGEHHGFEARRAGYLAALAAHELTPVPTYDGSSARRGQPALSLLLPMELEVNESTGRAPHASIPFHFGI